MPRTSSIGCLSQNCEDAPQSGGSYRVVIYNRDSSGAVLGKQPIFVIDGVFVISVLISVCITCVVIAGAAVAILAGCLKKNFKGEVS